MLRALSLEGFLSVPNTVPKIHLWSVHLFPNLNTQLPGNVMWRILPHSLYKSVLKRLMVYTENMIQKSVLLRPPVSPPGSFPSRGLSSRFAFVHNWLELRWDCRGCMGLCVWHPEEGRWPCVRGGPGTEAHPVSGSLCFSRPFLPEECLLGGMLPADIDQSW